MKGRISNQGLKQRFALSYANFFSFLCLFNFFYVPHGTSSQKRSSATSAEAADGTKKKISYLCKGSIKMIGNQMIVSDISDKIYSIITNSVDTIENIPGSMPILWKN